MTTHFSMPHFVHIWLATAVAALVSPLAWAAPAGAGAAAAQKNLEDMGGQLIELMRPPVAAPAVTLGLQANAGITRLVAVQVKSAVLPEDIESYWQVRIGSAVSVPEISDFHAWFHDRAAREGFMAYAKTEVVSARGGQQLNVQVIQPKINSVRTMRPESQVAAVHLKRLQGRIGEVFQVGLPLDTLTLDQVLDSAAYDLPVELFATLRSVAPELLNLWISIEPSPTKPGQTSSGVLQVNSHGLRQYGQTQTLAALKVGMPAAKSELSLLAQASEGVRYVRADYEGLVPALAARWTVFGNHSRSHVVTGGGPATEGDAAELGVGLSRILGARRDLVFKGDVALASLESESRLRADGQPLSKVRDHQLRLRWSANNERLSPHPLVAEVAVLQGHYPLAVNEAVPAGHYTRVNFAIRKQTPLNRSGSLRVSARVRGQWASRNLESYNQFTLGGVHGVRAYTALDGLGDHGVLASVALTRDIGSAVSVSAFYDAGQVRVQTHPLPSTLVNRYSLQGVGLALQARSEQLHYAMTWAKGHKSYAAWQPSNTESSPGNSRANVSVTYLF